MYINRNHSRRTRTQLSSRTRNTHHRRKPTVRNESPLENRMENTLLNSVCIFSHDILFMPYINYKARALFPNSIFISYHIVVVVVFLLNHFPVKVYVPTYVQYIQKDNFSFYIFNSFPFLYYTIFRLLFHNLNHMHVYWSCFFSTCNYTYSYIHKYIST